MSSPTPDLPADALPASTLLFGGQYQVDSMLGRGGFGLTYLCAEPALLRWVAIKELFPPGATRTEKQVVPPRGVSVADWSKAKSAFVVEARRLATFADPCVVRVFGVWEENGTAYMAMEALDGGSLLARLKTSGRMTPERVAELGLSLCRALTLLHNAHLLHRDLKPENIFFAPDDSPVLIDFGNARSLVAQQTQTVSLALTPGYASPEAYASRATLTAAADIYSLGATLWECLSGSPPPDAADRALGAPLPDIIEVMPKCPPLLVAALEHALELKPEARFQNAGAFAAQLGAALQAIHDFEAMPHFEMGIPAPTSTTTAPASGSAPPLPWTTTPDVAPCAFCGQPVKILDSICPHCGRFKSGYVPGQHLRRRPRANNQTILAAIYGTVMIVGLIVVGGVFSRFSSAIRGGNTDTYDDTSSKLRLQSTQLRRDLGGTQWVYSIRPQFRSGSVDIVASPSWAGLSRNDKMNAAKEWAQRWKDARAPLPAPFQITDEQGRVLGGRTTGSLEPWIK